MMEIESGPDILHGLRSDCEGGIFVDFLIR